jgi:hypothetical protein
VAGLNLRAGLGAHASAGAGGLYPVPAPASPSAPSSATVAAYGPVLGGATGPRTAAIGAGASGIVAALLLAYIWWSLPR